jgi:hypothetical protein
LDGEFEPNGIGLVWWDAFLHSYVYEKCRWEGPVMVADKRPSMDRGGNSHGLYATKEPNDIHLPCLRRDEWGRVLGLVGLYGTIVEGETGYRAEKMVVRQLYLLDRDIYVGRVAFAPEAVLGKLAARYELEPGEVHVGYPPGVRFPAP